MHNNTGHHFHTNGNIKWPKLCELHTTRWTTSNYKKENVVCPIRLFVSIIHLCFFFWLLFLKLLFLFELLISIAHWASSPLLFENGVDVIHTYIHTYIHVNIYILHIYILHIYILHIVRICCFHLKQLSAPARNVWWLLFLAFTSIGSQLAKIHYVQFATEDKSDSVNR